MTNRLTTHLYLFQNWFNTPWNPQSFSIHMLRCTQDYQHFVPYNTDAGSALDRGFLGMGDPQVSMGFNTKIVQFWMMWGYQHVRKPPHPRNLMESVFILGSWGAFGLRWWSIIVDIPAEILGGCHIWGWVEPYYIIYIYIIIYYHILGNKHPLTSHMRVPFGCQGFDS